jgi:hypothetical protein
LEYRIGRDGTEFGPYSLADVQRYVGTGNILLTDLALAEGSSEWIPVSQVVGTIAVPFAPLAPVYAPTPGAQYADPPNLHWGLLLLFSVLTCALFYYAWAIVQASWMKRIEPASKALFYYIGGVFCIAVYLVMAFRPEIADSYGIIFRLGGSVLMIAGAFSLRASLEEHYNSAEPLGLTLSGIMTFFFPTIYFQYHFNRINQIKRSSLLPPTY